jgi:hypothetical protein
MWELCSALAFPKSNNPTPLVKNPTLRSLFALKLGSAHPSCILTKPLPSRCVKSNVRLSDAKRTAADQESSSHAGHNLVNLHGDRIVSQPWSPPYRRLSHERMTTGQTRSTVPIGVPRMPSHRPTTQGRCYGRTPG